ncbi:MULTISPECIES: DUF3613 domain-containing protein [unclassified Stenotrophomonas]|uniref:DUF3613 domain-containing protein n=1 Tax=unclassified Stenotrophomonas TaxID=196198 RepID=UPI000D164523|nr:MULTISPECIES: DUF3613 domain-containing protein [unclassified Stenotrophomonas]PTA73029.1 DUF3613 domain-containing protein [Stenotrophomonas sp. Nf1]PTA76840.1 DUF3613 domain-containing protein [Stenotrophomonas sp. Nf4]
MTATPLIRRLLPALACALVASVVHAQQPPLTGQMLGGPAPAPAPAPAPTPQPMQAETVATVDLTAPATPAAPPPAMAPAPLAEAADSPLPAPAREPLRDGDTTRNLFRLQASGQRAGQRLPILGDQATLSYARYLKSFEHEIPDFFETDVARSKDASSSGR